LQESERLIKDPGEFVMGMYFGMHTNRAGKHSCYPVLLISNAVPGISAAPFEDNLRYFNVVIEGPKETPYEGGLFKLEMYLPDEYPMVSPVRQPVICGGISSLTLSAWYAAAENPIFDENLPSKY
jgi:hypothetical protein